MKHEAFPFLHAFAKNYQKYAGFREANDITQTTKYANLPESTLLILNAFENNLALEWNMLRKKGYDEFFLITYPALRPFCKALVKIYEERDKEIL